VVRSRDVIAGLHLDHSPTFDKVVECIRDGYTSVMFDGSTLPLEQNLQLTRDVVRVARPAGVSVEAEVGTIGTTAEYGAEIENPHLADPAACEAIGETGYRRTGGSDQQRARCLHRRTQNSTSTSSPKSDGAPKCHWCCTAAQQSRSTRSRRRSAGVAKMNVGTAIHVAFKEGMEEGLAENPGSHDIMKILSGCQPRVRDVLRQYVDITMSAGRA
jgi:fructose/tagatose bisphosphate aldolase